MELISGKSVKDEKNTVYRDIFFLPHVIIALHLQKFCPALNLLRHSCVLREII